MILTHYHFDHAGSVADVASQAPQAAVWAGAADIPEIPLQREIRPAADGAEVFGLRIVATPGHTAGHISVLDPAAPTPRPAPSPAPAPAQVPSTRSRTPSGPNAAGAAG